MTTYNRANPQNLPLDRINRFRETAEEFVYPKTFNSRTYFQNLLGTTKTDNEAVSVVLHFSPERSKYVETKKIHPTQKATRLPDGRLEGRLLGDLDPSW
ncbi:WYL domain-containing protein [Spirosoma aureum]|uniref:WYL domain-containing protein n=1 Tax=Spirosoma aureum TaxID=2692134 RepID=A0A6G9AW78_9BACT|nr:WYL domain-containing protein [Spirosoma aureum]QIP16727.1 WYL domain-containing protein [Spirosoma aureum]